MSVFNRLSIIFRQSGFNPSKIPNLINWIDASDDRTIELNGNGVSVWKDKSPAQNDYIEQSAALQPQYTGSINGLKTTVWDTTRRLRNQNIFTRENFASIFFVVKTTSTQTNNGVLSNDFFGFGTIDFRFGLGISTFPVGKLAMFRNEGPNLQGGQNHTAVSNDGNPHFHGIIINQTNISLIVDTVRQEFGSTVNGIFRNAAPTLGAGFQSAPQFNGDIAELIIYNRVLDDPEIDQIRDYLTVKWGI